MTSRDGTAEPPDDVLGAGDVDKGADQRAGCRPYNQAHWPGEKTHHRTDQATPDASFRCHPLRLFQRGDPSIIGSLDNGHGLQSELSGAVDALQLPDAFPCLFRP